MDNVNNVYTPSSSKPTMTTEALTKLVNKIMSVVLEGTTIVYPREETNMPYECNHESFMGYRPTHFETSAGMANPTFNCNQGIRQRVIPKGNNQKRKLTEREAINPNFTNAQDCYRKHLENHINYHRQLEYKQKASRECLATPVTKSGYQGSQPLCQKCGMHHTGDCIFRCRKCWKTGHKTSDCKTPVKRGQSVVCHGCSAKGHYKNQCPNYKINWKAKTFGRE